MINSDKIKFEFDFVDPCLCNAWIAAAVIGSSVIGAGASIWGASKAAEAQTSATDKAAAIQQQQYEQTRTDLAPYREAGVNATDELNKRLKELTTPITMDQDTLENTPGYQFNLRQGQRAVTNSSAARGLASSGAALKGAATFATGLADSTYQNQFNNANTNQTNAYTRLKGLIDTGENAGAQTGVLGEKAAYNTGTALVSGANAQAAADNKIGSAVSTAANNAGGYAAYRGIYGTPTGPAITYGGPNGPTPFT